MRIGSLFSGAGMLDEGVRAVLGGTVAWHAEVDPAACRVLAHRYPDVPNLGDVTAVRWAQVQPVAVITAGYPCQPFSDAGQRKAEDDARYLWPQVARAIRDMGPRLVVLENVRGHLVRGFARVVGELSELGYDAQWTALRASDVGAPHRRERLFCLAWPIEDTDSAVSGERWLAAPGQTPGGWARADAGGSDRMRVIADASSERRGQGSGTAATAWGQAWRAAPISGAAVATNANGQRPCHVEPRENDVPKPDSVHHRTIWGAYEPAIRRWERTLGRPAPAPTETAPRGGQRLSPRFVEWLMGWPEGWVTDVPGVTRNAQLKICGNGVVPQQAAEALRRMLNAEQVAA